MMVLLAAVGITGTLILLLGPLSEWAAIGADDLKGKEKADVINSTRQTLLAAAGGSIALAGLGFTARTYYLSRRGQFTDRYSKAIVQLASEKTTERLGGVYALEHLMLESERDHSTVIEVLAAFIREQTDNKRGMFPQDLHTHNGPQPAFRALPIDVQAALTALGRRPERVEQNQINLSMADLCGADLSNLRLNGANLWGAKLQHVIMHGVQLRGANLSKAQLQDSRMGYAQLQGAQFYDARMQYVTLNDAQLQGANLSGAGLENSNFSGANLQDVNLAEANLNGASFNSRRPGESRSATGLTANQLVDATMNETTILPTGLPEQLIQHQRQRLYGAFIKYQAAKTNP